jgi:hypothetical protein
MAKIELIKVNGLTWKQLAALFASSFGIIWLFIEPLNAFGLTDNFNGWLVYAFLMLCSIMITLLFDIVARKHNKSKFHWIEVTIIFRTEGARYQVKAPRDMSIRSFIIRLGEVLHARGAELLKWNIEHQEVVLDYWRDGKAVRAKSDRSFLEQNIPNGSECDLVVFNRVDIVEIAGYPYSKKNWRRLR